MRRMGSSKGFTLVELTVVVLIIGILVTVAIASFLSSEAKAARTTCLSNERISEGMYLSWHTETGDGLPIPSDWPELSDRLVPDYLAEEPVCPSGGVYSFTTTQSVVCDVHGHY